MEGIENTKKKLKLTLQQDVPISRGPDIAPSKSPDVKESDSMQKQDEERPFRHKTTLYLTAKQYQILEQIYTKRKLEGKRCDRYELVGEAIEKTFLPELKETGVQN